MWQEVCDRYNRQKNERAPFRDYDACKNKFKLLKSHKKPTGDPHCPPLVKRAKQIDRDIQTGASVINLNSDENSSIQDDQDHNQEEELVPGSQSGDDLPISPVALREGLSSRIVEETMPGIVVVVDDSFPHAQQPHNVHSDDGAGSDDDKAQKQEEESEKFEAKKNFKVPPRLGKDAAGLGAILQEVQEKNREAEKQRKRKGGVPENPAHSRKKILSKEIQDIDEEFAAAQAFSQRNFALQQKSMELRHAEEMKRLDQQNAMQERRFEAESQRHQSMMMMMFAAISGNRAALAFPVQPAPPNSDAPPVVQPAPPNSDAQAPL